MRNMNYCQIEVFKMFKSLINLYVKLPITCIHCKNSFGINSNYMSL